MEDNSKKFAKVMKFEIYTKDKDIYKILFDLFYETRSVMNKTLTFMYEWSNLTFIAKEELNLNLKPEAILKNENKKSFYKSADGYIYSELSKLFNKNASANRMTSIRKAVKLFKLFYKDILKGTKTIPVYKKTDKIYLYNKNLTFRTEEGNNYIDIALLSEAYAKEKDLSSNRHLFNIIIGDRTQRTIFNRILKGTYQIGESQLVYDKRKRKFFVYLTYKFEKIFNNTRDGFMGVKMGFKCPAYIAIHNSKARYKIEGGEIQAFRKQIEKLRFSYRKQRLTAGDGTKKRGRKTFLKPVTSIGDKVSRFTKLTNHRYSRYIVDLAKKNNCGIIYLEDLKGISTDNSYLKNWSYFELQEDIRYKAELEGITVVKKDCSYNNITCSQCGHIDTENVKQVMFCCASCEFESVIEYNASLNVANPDFDNLETVIKARKKDTEDENEGKEKSIKTRKPRTKKVKKEN